MIKNFDELFDQLRSKPKKRLVAAWAIDDHTISAVALAVKAGIVDGTLVGHCHDVACSSDYQRSKAIAQDICRQISYRRSTKCASGKKRG